MVKPDTSNAPTDADVTRQARRILRRLSETGAFLVLKADLEDAAVLRSKDGGPASRIATVPTKIAVEFSRRDWITVLSRSGRVVRCGITDVGRAALKRLLAEHAAGKAGRNVDNEPYQDQHRDEGIRLVMENGVERELKVNLAESPLSALARRKGPDGKPYLTGQELNAAELIRTLYENAHLGPRIAQNWESFLTPRGASPFGGGDPVSGPSAARERVRLALAALGPGLADIVLRCCCMMEGMEAAERRLGWAARSGKVVLKIALTQLAEYFEAEQRPLSQAG